MNAKRMNKIALYLEYIAFVLRDEAKKAEAKEAAKNGRRQGNRSGRRARSS